MDESPICTLQLRLKFESILKLGLSHIFLLKCNEHLLLFNLDLALGITLTTLELISNLVEIGQPVRPSGSPTELRKTSNKKKHKYDFPEVCVEKLMYNLQN